ncbi:MAG: hypothetical protein P8I03_06560 [Thalassotalea sp.]|nr:hypothetical protein [Thalassotalea sp.]
MLKGRYKAILFSLVVHACIFYLISQTVIVPPKINDIKPQAIKSFIYTPPKQEIKTAEVPVINKAENTDNEANPPEASMPDAIKKQVIESADIEQLAPKSNEVELESPDKIENTVPPLQTVQPPRNFSAYGQLKNLQNNLNNKIIDQESYQFSRRKTASIMDGKPELVPHSTKQFTPEEIKKKTSKQISSDINITKGDDGKCSIERDLSVVGMEGVKSVEGFNCGKSKFDKSFQDHMKKVLKKLGK